MAFTETRLSPEALAAAAELEIGESKSPAVAAVINDMLRPDSLPPGWQARYDPAKQRREYINDEHGEVQYTHPLLPYYRGAAYMESGGYRQLQMNEMEQPPAPQEVLDMCAYLGIQTGEDPYVMEVARLAISAPLPPDWTEGEDDEGNPLFSNDHTGQSQPSHPLDPYFLELIKRRQRELAIRSDGVGIRSAMAAKRLHAIGVPGIQLPPELQDAGAGGDDLQVEDTNEVEDEAPGGHGFGPLPAIEEAEDEGRDEEDEEKKKQGAAAAAAPAAAEDDDGDEEEDERERQRKEEEEERERKRKEEEERRRKEEEEEEEERKRRAEAEVQRREEAEEDEEKEKEEEEDDGPEAEERRLQEAQERAREAYRQRLVLAEQQRKEAELKAKAEAEAKAKTGADSDSDSEELGQLRLPPPQPEQPERLRLSQDEEDEEQREEEKEDSDKEVQRAAKEDEEEEEKPAEKEEETEAEADARLLREAQERAREAYQQRLREAEERRQREAADAEAKAEERRRSQLQEEEDEEEQVEKEEDEEEQVEKEEDEEDPPLPTLAAGISDLATLRQAVSMDSGISESAQMLPPPSKEPSGTAAEAAEAEAEEDEEAEGQADVTLVPQPPKPQLPQPGEDQERLVLDEEPQTPAIVTAAPKPPPTAEARGRKKADGDDDYDEDFNSYDDEDFHSFDDDGSRQASRDGRRTSGTERSATSSRLGTAQAAAAAPATPEKLPSRTPTPPAAVQVAAVSDLDRTEDEYGDDDVAHSASALLPSPPGAPPPDRVTPRLRSAEFGRSTSRDGPRVGTAEVAAASRSAAASTMADDDDDDGEAEAEPAGKDGDDEGDDVKEQEKPTAAAVTRKISKLAGEDGSGGEEDEMETLRAQAAAAAKRAAEAAAEFDAKFPPLPIAVEEGHSRGGFGGFELRRSRSFTDVETGRLLKQISAIEAARAVAAGGAASSEGGAAAAGGSIYALSRLPSGKLEVLQGRLYRSVGALSSATAAAAAPAAAAAAAATPPPRNALPPSRERIRVAVRARPAPRPGEAEAWNIDPENRTVRLKETAVNSTHRHISADRLYSFDLVLGPGSSTKQLWAGHVVPLMDASLSGMNTTVFAYGQTGSGKTYTMFGSDGQYEDGTISMSLTYLFKALQTLHKIKNGAENYAVKISMLELYNEQLRDLLAPGGGPFDRLGRPSGAPLALQDDPRVGVRVSGLEEHAVADMHSAMALVQRGAFSRSVGSTAMNEVSSRSHTIVRLALETREATNNELLHTSLVSFVDLAGSERLAKTGSTGARFVEGTNINISLLMLGTVVSKLAEGRVGEFIPYRNSKLTRLLQPCLGGNSKTAIIATINPSTDQIEETFNTLGFATRAMDVVNQVSVNSYVRSSGAVGGALSGAAAAALQKQVASLKAELAALRKEASMGGMGGTVGHGGDGGGGGGHGHGQGHGHAAVMAERLARLEVDKARLLDRLEVITGRPQGDVYDDLPPTPPDLNLPPSRPPGRSGSSSSLTGGGVTTPAAALRSIARIACVGRAGGKQQMLPRQSEQIPPEEVVMAVRTIRDERDELRRRDMRFRQTADDAQERLAELEPYRVLSEQVKEMVGMLENILGPSPLAESAGADDSDPSAAASHQAARLAENVQAVSMMHNELASLQRQLATSEAALAVASRRADNAETAMQRMAAQAAADWAAEQGGTGADARLKNLVEHLNSQLTAVRRELDVTKTELARWRGLAGVAPEVGGGDGDDDGEGNPARRMLNPASVNVGSFALHRAREALVQMSALENRCNTSEAERDELRERLQALEEALASGRPLPPMAAAALNAGAGGGGYPRRRGSGSGEDGAERPLSAAMGGPAGHQRFEQLKTHVSSLSREVSALTRERDSLLGMLLRAQGGQPNGGVNPQLLGAGGGGGRAMGANAAAASSLLYGGVGGGGGFPFGADNVFASVPLPSGPAGGAMGLDPAAAARARGGPLSSSVLDPNPMWEMDPAMAAALMQGGGSPVKLKPVRGRVPHHHHHHRHLRDDGYGSGGGNGNDGASRPDFNTRDVLESKQRINRLRDRASKLDVPSSGTPPGVGPMDVGLGIVAKGLGIPPSEPDPVLYGHRDEEMYALKRKLVMAEKARSEAAARSQSELRNLQYPDLLNYRGGGVGSGLGGGAPAGLSSQMALAAASRDFKEQARSHAVELRHMEVAHQENLAATRAEAAAVMNRLMEENNRLKLILAAGGSPGGGGGGGSPGPGNGAAASIDFSLAALGGFGTRDGGGGGIGMSYSVSPQRRAPAHLSPLRGSSVSPLRSQSNQLLPGLQQQQGQGQEQAYVRSGRGRVSSQRR